MLDHSITHSTPVNSTEECEVTILGIASVVCVACRFLGDEVSSLMANWI